MESRDALVSFVMPAHNTERFIGKSIKSVLAQSEQRWQLIIVDDCSTDSTAEIARRFAASDPRISIVRTDRNRSGALVPRIMGIKAARTPYILNLDSDDYVDPDFLQNMLERARKDNLDVLFPTMHIMRQGTLVRTIPADNSLYGRILNGPEAFSLTLDGWKISFNGGLVRRDVWLDTFRRFGEGKPEMLIYDEVLFRQMLLCAHRIGIAPDPYWYIDNPDSVTRKEGRIRLLHFLHNNLELLRFSKSEFGVGSVQYRLAQQQNFNGVVRAYRILGAKKFSREDRRLAFEMIRENRLAFDFPMLQGHVSPRYLFILKNIWLPASLIFPLLDRIRGRMP